MPHLKFTKTLTENPFIDELVYYTKVLGYSTVLKDEQQALQNETKESIYYGDLYVACIENKVAYDVLPINEEVLSKTTIDPENYELYISDESKIPVEMRNQLKDLARQYYIDNYEELNPYYRMLNGQPPLGDEGIFVDDSYAYSLPEALIIDLSKPIHKMSNYEIDILEAYGILDQIRADNPEALYLDYLAQYKISIYEARKADRFEILYIDSIEAESVYEKFKDRLIINREYILHTVYSEAYKYGSDHYDGFISSLIILQTMTDIIGSVQEFIAEKEIFDSRSIRYLLASNNIPYYGEIPIKYQRALIKNLHKLIKYKSTDKNIIDICSLFGFENINVFRYYLLRDRLTDDNGHFIHGFREYLDEDGLGHYKQDDSIGYDLKFVKVPLEESADDYIKQESSYVDYNEITENDWSWANGIDPEELKNDILRKEFNYIRTKYYSIENVYDVSKLSFEIPYFFNILYDNKKLEELLSIDIYGLVETSHTFKLSDLICFMMALTYAYHNIEDDIIAIDQQKVLAVLGFNFKADLEELNSYIIDKRMNPKDFGFEGFDIPDSSILTMNQLVQIFTNNRNIYNHVLDGMRHAENKRIYDIYKKIYDSLLLTEHTNEFFRLPNGEMPETLTEYLASRDAYLYRLLMDIKDSKDNDTKENAITSATTIIVDALSEWLDSDNFKYIYTNIPGVSSEFIKRYIIKLILFFKSYKADIINSINTVYVMDDKFFNWIKIIDDMELTVKTKYTQFMEFKDVFINTSKLNPRENLSPRDKVYIDVSTWLYLKFKEDKITVEEFMKIVNTMTYRTDVDIREVFEELLTTTSLEDSVKPIDTIYNLLSSTTIKDRVTLHESIPTLMYLLYQIDKVGITDTLLYNNTHDLSSVLQISDVGIPKSIFNITDKVGIRDTMVITRI